MTMEQIAIGLWFVSIIEMIIVGLLFFRYYARDKMKFYIGVAVFYMLFVVARILEIIRLYFNPEGALNPPYLTLGWNFWLKTGYTLFSYIGLTIIYFVLERYVFTRTKYIFTIFVPITTIISIWFTIDVALYDLLFLITIPLYLLILFGIIGMYIYLAVSTSGEVRRNSILIIFGIFLFELGLVFALPEAQISLFSGIPVEVLWVSAPILSIIGVILQIGGFRTSVE
ncbi:MAG: hypothetical protein ACTSQI_01750 [Candidatus Helarchaeota archaeon]